MFVRLCCVIVAGAALMVIGCESAPKAAPNKPVAQSPKPRPQAPAMVEDNGEQPASLSARLLAEQSQRDVQAILASQSAVARSPEIEQPSTHARPANAPPAIIWNDAAFIAQTEAVAVNAESQTQQAVLARIPAEIDPTSELDTSSSSQSSQSTESSQADRLQQLMVDLSRELYATGAYSDQPLRELMVIASMTIVDSNRKLDPQAIPDLTESERLLLGHLQNFFAQLGQTLETDADLEISVAGAAGALRDALVKPPQLTLRTAALCTRVGGFGDYSCFERNTFLASSQQKVIVYLEIDQFTSELNASSEYVTQIAQQLTIYSDRDGIPVWKEDWQTAVDVSRNKRQDFFTVQVITLPPALSVGKYQLKIRARDEKSDAEAESSIAFEVVADPRMAATK